MTAAALDDARTRYRVCLTDYLKARSERALYQASLLGQSCVEAGMGPEEIIAVHAESLEHAMAALSPRQVASAGVDGLQFLLEVMIAYGVHYQHYLELRMAEQMREAEEARRKARTQADIMATISHELRTPVTIARGSIDLATRSLGQQQHDKVAPLLEAARQALSRLSRMTADLYEASRGEMPKLERHPEDLTILVAQAYEWAIAPAAEKGVELTYAPADESLLVLGDADALLSALGNLISNAIRYTPGGGQVTVSTGGEVTQVWAGVADTGIGMTPEVQAHIFERFYRAPEAKSVDAHGLGLGLSLTHQLVLAHGGTLMVESEPGRGSAFRITLPRHAPVPAGAASNQEEATRHDGT